MTDAPPPVAVVAILRREDGRYLLIRRAASRPGGGHWAPVTGRPEPDEPLERTVEREVLEEVGLEVRTEREILRSATDDGRWRLVWFEVSLTNPISDCAPLRFQLDEVSDGGWFTLDEIAGLSPMFEGTRIFFAGRAR